MFGIKEGSPQGQSTHVGGDRDLHSGLPSSFMLRVLLADASINSYFGIMGRDSFLGYEFATYIVESGGCLLRF